MFNTLYFALSLILLLFYAYVYVWSREPRDGKLTRTIRKLTHDANYWRKRSLRDESILSKVIDKKRIALAVVLVLFLIPIANPAPYSIPAAIGNESNEKPFFAAGDGDESSESITSFSETTDDDRMLYPDCEEGDATNVYDYVVGDGFDYTDTYQTIDCSETGAAVWFEWWGLGYGSGTEQTDGDFLRITAGADADGTAVGFFCDEAPLFWDFVHLDIENVSGTWWFEYYNATSVAWETVCSSSSDTGEIIIDLTEDYANSANVQYVLVISHGGYITLDWVIISDVHYVESESSDVYTESFADVSDWTGNTLEAQDGFTSDGDLMEFEGGWDGGSDFDWVYDDSMSFAAGSRYLEFRYMINASVNDIRVGTTTGDAVGGSTTMFYPDQGLNTWYTFKGYISAAVESIFIIVKTTSDTPYNLKSDYGRLGDETEMGWQHDGSTTEGASNDAEAGFTYTTSSDGDVLSCNVSRDSGSGSTFVALRILFDMTATAIDLERDYYPFWGARVRVSRSSAASEIVYVSLFADGYLSTVTSTVTSLTSWTTVRANHKASSSANANEYFRIGGYLDAVDDWINLEVEWIKAYSIANASISLTNTGTDDYLYISSTGCIRGEVTGATTLIDLTWVPVLSVDTSVYNVWNTTGCSCSTGVKIDGSWTGWTAETRGGMDAGTLTSFGFRFCCCEAGCICVKDIKFIEDGTAPDILDKFIDPGEPYDDEPVTIMCVAYDSVEVWTCTINAVVCPAAFSDVDYEMTETDQEHVFTYDFSTLTAGYYLFQIQVSDAANTYEEYISIRVREAEILITTYTFFGASSDFSYMQYSGHINRDCTYNISEWSVSWAKNETHTGSVTEGMFNIAWDKIGVDDLNANFTIIFLNGSLSLTIEGFYGTAYKELRITEIEIDNPETSLANTNITVNFYANKDIDWFVYDVDDSDAVLASGSSVEGSGVLLWEKDRSPHIHNYAIKWTDGVSNIWFNSSYWTFRENIDSIDQPGKDWGAIDTRRTIEFWTTLTGIVLIVGLIVIGASHYRLNKKIKNLPNYSTQR